MTKIYRYILPITAERPSYLLVSVWWWKVTMTSCQYHLRVNGRFAAYTPCCHRYL